MDNKIREDKAGVIMFPPLLFLLTLLIGLLLSYLAPYQLLPVKVLIMVGMLTIAFGFFIPGDAVGQLKKHETSVNPAGPTTAIVKERIYNRSRNPIYLSFASIYTGISFLFNAWAALPLPIALLIITQKGIVEREEKYLTKKFGNEYLSYKIKVPGWI